MIRWKIKVIFDMAVILPVFFAILLLMPHDVFFPETLYWYFFIQIVCVVLVFFANRVTERQTRTDIGFATGGIPRQLGYGLVLFLLLSFLFFGIPHFSGAEQKMFLPVYFAGFGTEILFRGYFYDRFFYFFHSKNSAVFLCAVFFGVGAFISSGFFILPAAAAFTMGLLLGSFHAHVPHCSVLSTAIAGSFLGLLLFLLSP